MHAQRPKCSNFTLWQGMPPTTIERLAVVEINGLGEVQQGTLIVRLGKVERAALGSSGGTCPIRPRCPSMNNLSRRI